MQTVTQKNAQFRAEYQRTERKYLCMVDKIYNVTS